MQTAVLPVLLMLLCVVGLAGVLLVVANALLIIRRFSHPASVSRQAAYEISGVVIQAFGLVMVTVGAVLLPPPFATVTVTVSVTPFAEAAMVCEPSPVISVFQL